MASLKEKFQHLNSAEQGGKRLPFSGEQPALLYIPVAQIEPDSEQPRKDLGDLCGLTASIKEHGILQPVIVSPIADEQFRLIAGERRFAAARELRLLTVPAIVRTMDQHRRLEVQLVENLHRKELNPIEEAGALQRLIEEFSLSQRVLADRLGRSTTAINQTLRILSLPEEILLESPNSERLSRSVLLEMVKLGSKEAQLDFWSKTLDHRPTVRQVKQARLGRNPKKTGYRFPRIDVDGGSVLVVLHSDFGSVDDLRNALVAALDSVKA